MLAKINSRIIAFLFLTLALGCATSCSNNEDIYGSCEIIGSVKDNHGNAVTGANITVMLVEEGGIPAGDITDAEGNFKISITKATPKLLLEISAEGYEDYYREIIPEFKNSSFGETLGYADIVIDDIILIEK